MGRIAGIDFGTVRIGIAVSDPDQKIVSPLTIFHRKARSLEAAFFVHLVKEQEITKFVVGLPLHLDGKESQKSKQARAFGAWLEETTKIPVEFFDERFTSFEAEQMLQAAQFTKKKRKQRLDALAAQLMLDGYLESTHPQQQTERGIDD